MIPLRPPSGPAPAGYPTRDELLADPLQRSRVLAALAAPTLAMALGGCGGSAPTPEVLGGATVVVPPPGPASATAAQPGPQPLAGKPSAPASATTAQPARLAGDVPGPTPPATEPLPPVPTRLGGMPVAVPPPKPATGSDGIR